MGWRSTCWTTWGGSLVSASRPPQSGQCDKRWGYVAVTSSALKGTRTCGSCPGCPPMPRLGWFGSAGGLVGLTMSDDGGLDDVEESFFAAANCFWSCWSASSKCCTRSSNACFSCWSFAHWEQLAAGRFFMPSILDAGAQLARLPVNGYRNSMLVQGL